MLNLIKIDLSPELSYDISLIKQYILVSSDIQYIKLSICGHSFNELIFFVCLIILQSLAPLTYPKHGILSTTCVCVADTHV